MYHEYPPLQIGPYKLSNNLVLAPMAGISDKPYRQLCKKIGAGLTVSEMVGSRSLLAGSKKTLRRTNYDGETKPKAVQIVGACPKLILEAAIINVDLGAEIIDINMGCPAKKVCNMQSGSALLKDEKLVKKILETLTCNIKIPVTLKIRTGWDKNNKNALEIAKIAENSGIYALTVHGRTRQDFFKDDTCEYDTIAKIKQSIKIPVIANGDINSPLKAKEVLDYTKADGIMIGRAALGNPWIFKQINHYFETNEIITRPPKEEIHKILLLHLENIYNFYGEYTGVRMARKHISWYSKGFANGAKFRNNFNQLLTIDEQKNAVNDFFEHSYAVIEF